MYNLLDEGEKKKVLTDKKRLIHALQTPGMTKRAGFRPYCCRKGERPMKGVNKRVIEINRPESEYIEKVLIFLRAFIIRGTFYTEGYEKIQDFDLMIDFGLKYFGIGVTTEESYDSVVYAIRQLSLS